MVAGTKRGIKFLSITLQSVLQYSIACTSFGRIQNKKQTNKQRKSTHWVSRVHSCSGFRPHPPCWSLHPTDPGSHRARSPEPSDRKSEPSSCPYPVALSANQGLAKCGQVSGILIPLPQGLAAPAIPLFLFSLTMEWHSLGSIMLKN